MGQVPVHILKDREMSKHSFFTIEEADIVRLEASDDAQVREGWINVGAHAVLLELDESGQLTVEICARTNEGPPLAKIAVTEAESLAAGGSDPDKPQFKAYDDMSESEKSAFDMRQGIRSSDRTVVEAQFTSATGGGDLRSD